MTPCPYCHRWMASPCASLAEPARCAEFEAFVRETGRPLGGAA